MNELVKVSNLDVDNVSCPVLELPGRPKAILDRHIAVIFDVETKRVNEAVKNNPSKFPDDFLFQLTPMETSTCSEVENFDFDWKGGHLPRAFTQEGCNMLATILRSELAIRRSVQIIRGFTSVEKQTNDLVKFANHPTIKNFLAIQKLKEENDLIRREQSRQRDMLIEQIQRSIDTEKKVERIGVRSQALMDDGLFTIDQYAFAIGLKLADIHKQALGREAARMSKEQNIPYEKVPVNNKKYKFVGKYNQEVLRQVFKYWKGNEQNDYTLFDSIL